MKETLQLKSDNASKEMEYKTHANLEMLNKILKNN